MNRRKPDRFSACTVEELMLLTLSYRLARLMLRTTVTQYPRLRDLLRLWILYRLPMLVDWRLNLRVAGGKVHRGLTAVRHGHWKWLRHVGRRQLPPPP